MKNTMVIPLVTITFFFFGWWIYFAFPNGPGIIGGLIAFFVLRQDDPSKAKNCLYLGIALMVVGIIMNLILAATIPGLDSGFNVNV